MNTHCITHYSGAAYNYPALKEAGITHIISAARSARDNYPEDIRYLDVNMCTEKMSPGEIQEILAKTSAFIAEATSRKDFKVLVHDWEGAGRSAVLIVAHIMQTRRITFDAAVEIVRKTRPGINIEDDYEVQLLQLEQDMHLLPTEKQKSAAAQGHVDGTDVYDYGSDMDDVDAFDQVAKDSSSSDGFLDEFGSAEDNEYEVNSEDYEDDDGSHFWGQESYDEDDNYEEEEESSDESNSDEDYITSDVDEDDDGSHWWGQESYDDEEEEEEDSLSLFDDSVSSSDEYWWGHVEPDIGDEAFDEGEDDDLNEFIYFEDEDDTDFIGSSDEDISILPKE